VVTNANLTGAITSVGNATSLGSFSSANLAGALTDETGSGAAVFATSPTLVTPILGTPSSGTLSSCTGLPISTGVSGLGTGIATALAVNTGSAGAPVLFNGALGTPTSGTVTNLTGTASININGTVGATTPSTGAFTTLSATGTITSNPASGDNVNFQNGAGVSLGKVFNDAGFFNFQGSANVSGTRIEHPTQVQNRINGATITTTNSTGLAVTGVSSATSTGGGAGFSIVRTGGSPSTFTMLNSGGEIIHEYNAVGYGFNISTARVASISSTGLAVTGALSSTTTLQAKQSTTNPASTGALPGLSMGFDAGGEVSWIQSERNSLAETRSLLLNPNGGNVGIGTASPGEKLTVYSATDTYATVRSASQVLAFNAGTGFIGSAATSIYNTSAIPMIFGTNNAERARINDTGLAVTGALSATGDVGIGAAPNAGFALDITRSGVDVKQRMANSSSGNVQIGMTTVGQQDWAFGVDRSDSGKFKIAASGAVASSTAITLTASGAVRFNTYGAGALTTDASGNITAASDERIKKNIRPFSRGLAEILAINPILHGYTEESGLDQTRDDYAGFSAQQVQSLIPEAIGENADGMLSFSDRPVMAALVNAMKELNANLVAQVAALSQRLAALEAK
jgi:hypothetical protein